MKKGLKKFLSVLLVMTMLVSVFSVSSFAADVTEDITEVTEQENVPGTEDSDIIPDEDVPETDVETPTEEEDSGFGIEFVGPGEYGENLLNAIKTAFFFTINFPQICISMVIFGPVALLAPVILLFEYASVFGALFGIKVDAFIEDESFFDIIKDNFEMNLDFLDMYI